MVDVISRAQWGARPWRGGAPHTVSPRERTEFFVHYYGAAMPVNLQRGTNTPRAVQSIHLANGWSGTGYNFMVDMDGVAYEGRGWNMVGAHCPNHNRQGIGVFLAVGQGQAPTEAALRTTRDLYDEACFRSARLLAKKGHRDGKQTACPGDLLYDWVRGGMVVNVGGTAVPAPRAIGDGSNTGRPILDLGTKGRHVEALQTALLAVGYSLQVDGDFGPMTQKIVVDLQDKGGLKPDGIVGPATYELLSRLIPDHNPIDIPDTTPEEDDMKAQLLNLTGTRRFFLARALEAPVEVSHAELQANRAAGLVAEPGKAVTADELRLLGTEA